MVRLNKAAAGNELQGEVYDMLKDHYPEKVLGWVKDATWTLRNVPLDQINMSRRPGGRNMDKVERIAQAIRDGKKMGPVVLVKQSTGRYQVADGYHRTLGFKKADKTEIRAYVASGVGDDGPWDEEMHANKLNVEPGKKASFDQAGFRKLAREALLASPMLQRHSETMLKLFRAKEFQKGLRAADDVKTTGVRGDRKEWASFLGMARHAGAELVELPKIANEIGEDSGRTNPDQELGILGRLGVLAGTTGVGAGAGFLADRRFKSLPIGTAMGGLAGLLTGAVALGETPSVDTVSNAALTTFLAAQRLQELRAAQQAALDAANKPEPSKEKKPDMQARSGTFTTRKVASETMDGLFKLAAALAPGYEIDLRYDDLPLTKVAWDTDEKSPLTGKTIKKPGVKPERTREYYLRGVGKKQDKKGWYVHTHRARSKSYESIDKIPMSVLKFIHSTG